LIIVELLAASLLFRWLMDAGWHINFRNVNTNFRESEKAVREGASASGPGRSEGAVPSRVSDPLPQGRSLTWQVREMPEIRSDRATNAPSQHLRGSESTR
jgi:hypothetical protein